MCICTAPNHETTSKALTFMDHTNKHTIIYLHLVSVPQTAPPLARSSILLEYSFINTHLALPSVPFLLHVPDNCTCLPLPPFLIPSSSPSLHPISLYPALSSRREAPPYTQLGVSGSDVSSSSVRKHISVL